MKKKATPGFSSILSFLLIVVIAVFFVRFVFKKLDEPQGFYLEYNGQVYEEGDDGIYVDILASKKFTVKNKGGWGVYSPTACRVKIYANTTTACKFSYTVGNDVTPYYFSLLGDVTRAFVEEPFAYNGRGIAVNENGDFEFYFEEFVDMEKLLSRMYGQKVTLEGGIDTAIYPYFIMEITSPDDTEVIKLPMSLRELTGDVTGVEFDNTQIVF